MYQGYATHPFKNQNNSLFRNQRVMANQINLVNEIYSQNLFFRIDLILYST